MSFSFTKMHGLGNDFIVIDGINQHIVLTPTEIQRLSRRDTGIGFDQCLIIEPSHDTAICDFVYRIYNANGQEVGQCGNGARCIARFAHHYGLSQKPIIRVATATTTMRLELHNDMTVTVDMGHPRLTPGDIPLTVKETKEWYNLSLIDGTSCHIHALSVGNPHAILVVPNVKLAPVETLGAELSHHPLFPAKVNVSFMQIINSSCIKLRVYERGCGETQACGSAAVAAMAAGHLYHNLEKEVTVSLPGGDLTVSWPNKSESIFLRGPATFVYEGRVWS